MLAVKLFTVNRKKEVPTSESELCSGLDLPDAPGHEALVHAVVLPLQVKDLQRLAVDGHPAPAPADTSPCLSNDQHSSAQLSV